MTDRPELSALHDGGRLDSLRATGLLDSPAEPAFDRAVSLVKRCLGVPVSLVSLVEPGRQFFKAQSGLRAPLSQTRETPLSHSFCQHVVARDAPLVVRDARAHPVLAGNGAVTDMNAVGYLGVPLRDVHGYTLGSLCAITDRPRDWSDDEIELMTEIATGVESEIRLRQNLDIARRERESFHAILNELPVGVVVARRGTAEIVMRNRKLREIASDVSDPSQGVAGHVRFNAEHPDGRPLREEDYPIVRAALHGEAVTNEPMVFRLDDGRSVELDVTARRVEGSDLAVGVVIDQTERKRDRAELRRRDARLARFHDLTSDGILQIDGENRVIFANAAVLDKLGRGAERLEGTSIFSLLPAGSGLDLESAFRAARDGSSPAALEATTAEGQVFEIRIFPDDERLLLFLRDVTEENRQNEGREALIRELNHRVKNLFTVVGGMISMTARVSHTPREMAESLRNRVRALATAHDLIRPSIGGEAGPRQAIAVSELVAALISPHLMHATEHLSMSGPALHISPDGVTNLALVLHELATNAAKYGALSVPGGRLSVTWTRGDAALSLIWEERDGPAIEQEPGATGFGSQLVRTVVEGQLKGDLVTDWRPEGLRVTITLPLVLIEETQGA
ncbi:HWE histidine kinase domain-containing protein [Palleronia sediminis]|nr:HWE histidine kinase domain-containing protein [Palleronia sediminis]